jgi:hypothetical protein
MKTPRTPAQWQEAVDGAAGARVIADCMMYGLLQGDVEINVERCDYILEQGKRRGILPSHDPVELAIGLIRAMQEEAREQTEEGR